MNKAEPLAALPMYDFDFVASANDELWTAIAARLDDAGVEAPKTLTRGPDLDTVWRNPHLVFGQTCGYPYATRLKDTVALIAAPIYAFPGCEGASHRSFIIRRASDSRRDLAEFRGATAGLNARDSNTGMNLFRAAVAPLAGGALFFRAVLVTGSHEASVEAVAEGRADLAAIDCVSYALLRRGRPALVERVAIVAESPRSPSLPFIAAAGLPTATIAAVREALFAALADPNLVGARATLGLTGARIATPADYDRVIELERDAAAAGYPLLA
jgi:ABC-type phosphate/phosphonate transport system substrate-binding protein